MISWLIIHIIWILIFIDFNFSILCILIKSRIYILKSFASKIAVCIIVTRWRSDVATCNLLTFRVVAGWLLMSLKVNHYWCTIFNCLLWFWTFQLLWRLLQWRSFYAFHSLTTTTFHCFLRPYSKAILLGAWFRWLPYLWWSGVWWIWSFPDRELLRAELTSCRCNLDTHCWWICVLIFSLNSWCLISSCLWIHWLIRYCCRCIITDCSLTALNSIFAIFGIIVTYLLQIVPVKLWWYLIIEEVYVILSFCLRALYIRILVLLRSLFH